MVEAINPNWVQEYKRRIGLIEPVTNIAMNEVMIEQQPQAQEGEK